MSKKVYISPSDQVSNAYAWGNTNEHVQCQKIAEAEAAALRRSGVEVQVAALGSTMAQRCAQSNSFGADVHNCVHTNACNGKVMGTRLFCYAIPGKGYDACKAVFAELAPLSPGTSENVQKNPNLYEVRIPAAPTVHCECEFHDSADLAKWIVANVDKIGEAIANSTTRWRVPSGSWSTPRRSEKPSPRACASTWAWPSSRLRRRSLPKNPRPTPNRCCTGSRWEPSPSAPTPTGCWKS